MKNLGKYATLLSTLAIVLLSTNIYAKQYSRNIQLTLEDEGNVIDGQAVSVSTFQATLVYESTRTVHTLCSVAIENQSDYTVWIDSSTAVSTFTVTGTDIKEGYPLRSGKALNIRGLFYGLIYGRADQSAGSTDVKLGIIETRREEE